MYFNSPVDYLVNLTDEHILSQMRNKNIVIASGQGANEDPGPPPFNWPKYLTRKGIRNWLDIWGADMETPLADMVQNASVFFKEH